MLTAEQKRLRLGGVGGSEIGALVGANPYAGPLDVYASKVDGAELPVTHHMERGTFFEAGTANWYAHRTGAMMREVGTVFHPERKIAFCTPDRLVTRPNVDGEIDLSIKVPGSFALEQWGEPGTDDIPFMYLAQVQWELMILGPLYGITRAEIAAPVRDDLAVYYTVADPELQGNLLEAAERFWRDHVVPKKPPPPEGLPSHAAWLRKRFTSDKGPVIQADGTAERIILAWRAAKEAHAKTEKDLEKIRQALEFVIGDSQGIEGAFGKITYRRNKPSEQTNWEALAKSLGPPEEVIQQFTNQVPGARVLRPRWSNEDE